MIYAVSGAHVIKFHWKEKNCNLKGQKGKAKHAVSLTTLMDIGYYNQIFSGLTRIFLIFLEWRWSFLSMICSEAFSR